MTPHPSTSPSLQDRERALPVANTSMLPGSEKAPAPGVQLLKHALQGAHESVDRFGERAGPGVQRWGERVAGAQQSLQTQAARLLESRDHLSQRLRSGVRDQPLTALAVAMALGFLAARLTRGSR